MAQEETSDGAAAVNGKHKKKLKKKLKRKDQRTQEAIEKKKIEANEEEQKRTELELQILESQETLKNQAEHLLWEQREREWVMQQEEKILEQERLEKERQEEYERQRLEREEKKRLAQLRIEEQLKNPPKELPKDETFGTEKDIYNCAFFLKTGVCRYGDSCGKRHVYPDISNIVLFRNMYDGLGLTEVLDEETDEHLQYDDDEIKKHFEAFYYDVIPELEKYGRLKNVKICRNYAQHLRGNVYVEFTDAEAAVNCLNSLNGRFYASRQLRPEFVVIPKWKAAVCGLYDRKRCPKGKECNFLHVFHNPRGEYEEPLDPGAKPPLIMNERGRERDRERERGDKDAHRDRKRDRSRERDRDKTRDKDRERDRDKDRDKDRERDKDRDRRDRDKDRSRDKDKDRKEKRRDRSRERDRDHHREHESSSGSKHDHAREPDLMGNLYANYDPYDDPNKRQRQDGGVLPTTTSDQYHYQQQFQQFVPAQQ